MDAITNRHAASSLDEEEMLRVKQQDMLLNFDAETSPDHGESIDERLMHTVKDNTLGVRYEERGAYLRILRLAQEVPLRRQERFATEIRADDIKMSPAITVGPSTISPSSSICLLIPSSIADDQ